MLAAPMCGASPRVTPNSRVFVLICEIKNGKVAGIDRAWRKIYFDKGKVEVSVCKKVKRVDTQLKRHYHYLIFKIY